VPAGGVRTIPFLCGWIGKFSAQDDAAGFETQKRFLHIGCCNAEDIS